MNWREMAKESEGLHSIESFSRRMNIHRSTAITYIHEMRKKGFVETMRGKNGKRLYDISPLRLKKIGSKGLFDILNENSSLKIQEPYEHRVYGKELGIEEAIVEALKTGEYRIILASVELFSKVTDWSLLNNLAKENRFERHIGALYSLAKKYFRLKRMDKRVLRSMKRSPVRSRYIIGKMRSDDFRDIEKEWGVHVPFNKSDMERMSR